MNRCAACGGFYDAGMCERDHTGLSVEQPDVTPDVPYQPIPQGEWVSVVHKTGVGDFAEQHQSPAIVVGHHGEVVRLAIYGPHGVTVSDRPLSDVLAPINPLEGES